MIAQVVVTDERQMHERHEALDTRPRATSSRSLARGA